MSSRPGLLLALFGGLMLGVATPPAAVPLGEWLVLPALAVWFCVATEARRPALASYLFGCAHMAWFSWSVRHVMLPAYVAIVVVGGGYYLLASWLVRRMPAGLRGMGFGLAVAASFWLRAVMPEIHYPHGQPCHCLYGWPSLMRVAVLGGEPLFNALLAWVAAAGYGVWRSWRIAAPGWGVARRRLSGTVLVAAGAVVVGNGVVLEAARSAPGRTVEVLLVEPGLRTAATLQLAYPEWRAWWDRFEVERLVGPTQAALAEAPPVDLVVWPESSVRWSLRERDVAAGGSTRPFRELPHEDTLLLIGANLLRGRRATPAAFALGLPGGEVVGFQEKQRLVPGGEFLPFLALLPDSWSEGLRERFRAALGSVPDAVPGSARAPMETKGGVPFGALLCFDNAFPGPAADRVARGAALLVVLSNEAWYQGGGELQQLLAMTVVRACENATPIVRSTMDGWTGWVDGTGAVVEELPLDHGDPLGRARTLRVTVPAGQGKPPAFGWLRQASGAACGLLALLCGVLGWAGRRRDRS